MFDDFRILCWLWDTMLIYFYAVKVKLRLKSSQATYPTSNAKSLGCDTANEHALERHADAASQLSNGTNGVNLYNI